MRQRMLLDHTLVEIELAEEAYRPANETVTDHGPESLPSPRFFKTRGRCHGVMS